VPACLLEVAGEGVLCPGVRGVEAEPSLLVVAELTQAQGGLDRALAVAPQAGGGVEAVVAEQLPALVGDQVDGLDSMSMPSSRWP
jgi:hypothetical protein